MKNITLKTAVLAALSFTAVQATAAGFCTLPTSGASAYVQARTASNFGSTADNTAPPAADSACVAPNGVGVALSTLSAPEAGFVLQAGGGTSAITAFAETLGTLGEYVFKNGGNCIYEKQVVMSNTAAHDYHPTRAGINKMEVNDYAFGGYTGSVSAAYAKSNAVANSSVYRIGRTYTSVQMQAKTGVPGTIATGFKILPSTAAAVGTEISGVGQTAVPGSLVPGVGQQDAPFSANWVDFTTDVTASFDEDGTTNPSSPNMYIKKACATAAVSPVANSFKLRQTGQETQPWVTVTVSSKAPGSTITP
ncbi:MAG TPA: hypothetical protein PLJ94_07680, partial [Methylotenera sp.]|nr:hypothetical protein [Methylotenera sp.]HPH08542.1 hypothetical protein [Methylotenera sp.]HPM48676.1 hypothetical protein [Methylotenera sp.]